MSTPADKEEHTINLFGGGRYFLSMQQIKKIIKNLIKYNV